MKKRALTLTGAIIGTVLLAVLTVLLVIGSYTILAVINAVGGEEGALAGTMVGVIMLVMVAFAITALVLNIICIKAYSATPENYAKLKGVVITAIVFNFILAAYYLFSLFTAADAVAIVEYIIFVLVLVAVAVLYIVDLVNEKKNNVAVTNENNIQK